MYVTTLLSFHSILPWTDDKETRRKREKVAQLPWDLGGIKGEGMIEHCA